MTDTHVTKTVTETQLRIENGQPVHSFTSRGKFMPMSATIRIVDGKWEGTALTGPMILDDGSLSTKETGAKHFLADGINTPAWVRALHATPEIKTTFTEDESQALRQALRDLPFTGDLNLVHGELSTPADLIKIFYEFRHQLTAAGEMLTELGAERDKHRAMMRAVATFFAQVRDEADKLS